jgi:two-component system response regulator RegA
MATPDLKLLLADDDDVFRERLARALGTRGFAVRRVAGGAEAVAAVKAEAFDAALVDLKMPTQPEGAALVAALHTLRPEMRIVVLTGYGSIASALLAVREGAADYLTKPADADQVAAAIRGEGVRPPRPAAVPSLDRVEWEHIQRVLAETGGNVSESARLLGIDRRSLQRKLARYAPRR